MPRCVQGFCCVNYIHCLFDTQISRWQPSVAHLKLDEPPSAATWSRRVTIQMKLSIEVHHMREKEVKVTTDQRYIVWKLKDRLICNGGEWKVGKCMSCDSQCWQMCLMQDPKTSVSEINPMDYVYRSIGCQLELMKEEEVDSQYLLKYIHSTTPGQ